jgi:hypothetical protein
MLSHSILRKLGGEGPRVGLSTRDKKEFLPIEEEEIATYT